MKFLKTNKEKIIFVGDIHGNFDYLSHHISEYNLINYDIIICGDCGIGFDENWERKTLSSLNTTLKRTDNKLYFVRGNHDNPTFFDNSHGFNYNKNFSNITFVADYTIIQTNNINILCIGGGLSIDRLHRTEGKSYWKNEFPIYNEEELLGIKDGIDVIVTHTAPRYTPPFTKDGVEFFINYDRLLEEDVLKERSILTKVFDCLLSSNKLPKKWYYGHFHFSNFMTYKGVDFCGLDVYEVAELRI